MQHHIRKMVGLAIAVLRGFTGEDTILRSFKSDPLDLPKAPGLGLMLEEVWYPPSTYPPNPSAAFVTFLCLPSQGSL